MYKRQESAKEYLRLKEELKGRDANLFLLEHKALQIQISELDQKTSIAKGACEDVSNQSEQLKKEFDQLEDCLLYTSRRRSNPQVLPALSAQARQACR